MLSVRLAHRANIRGGGGGSEMRENADPPLKKKKKIWVKKLGKK